MNRWRAQLEGIRPLDASLAIGQTGKRINGFRPRDIGEPVAAMVSVVRFENVGLLYGKGAATLRDLNFALEVGSFPFLRGSWWAGQTSVLRRLFSGDGASR